MKKEKRKFLGSIVSYVLAFVCITSWVALGVVLALTSANISVNGKISFTANDVYADVTGTVTGTATTNTLEDIHLTADTTSFTTPSSWSNIAFDFVKGQDIVFTINITNKSTENSILVAFDDNISATNTTITRKLAGTTVTAFSALEVPKSTTKSVEITLSVKDKNLSVNGNFSLGLNLTSKEPAKDASEYSTLSFSVNNTSGTAEVKANSSNKPTGNLIIPGSVIIDGKEYAVSLSDYDEDTGSSAFQDCSELTSVTISLGVTVVGSGAFDSCSALTSVQIPSSVTSIGGMAFWCCSSLTSITIPSSVTSIGGMAFYACSSLTSITIPDSVTTIGVDAFRDCTSLTSVTIGKGATIEDNDAFSGCTSIESMIVDKDNTSYYSYENGLYARTTLICGGKNTIIKDGTTTIESWAFTGCTGLTSITIPLSVTYIGQEAFQGCSKLTSVTFENTTGWKAWKSSESESSTILSSADLANKATAATYLTSTYCGTWIRS